jgi:hypothetical protein
MTLIKFIQFLAFSILCTICIASVPKLINFQGRLTDANGLPADSNVSITLNVYDSESSGKLIYSEDIGTVEVKKGVYSFKFGNNGTSIGTTSEIFGPTDGTSQVFGHSVSNTPMISGSATITDGTTTWNEGVANSTLTVSIIHASGSVSAIYLTGVPSSGKTLTISYDYNSSGITSALLENNETWMEVVIDAQAFSPRKQLVAIPFALVANEALSFSGQIAESQLSVTDTSSELMTMIADLQGQIFELRAKSFQRDFSTTLGAYEIPEIQSSTDRFFQETFTDLNGYFNFVDTSETNATWGDSTVGYVCGTLLASSTDDAEMIHGGSGADSWRSIASFSRNHLVHHHSTLVTYSEYYGYLSYKVNFIYTDSTSTFSSTITGDLTRDNYGTTSFFANPYPSKIVDRVEVWTSRKQTRTKENRTYRPLPSGQTVKIKLNLPSQSKSVIATRVDILGQVLPTSTVNYDISDGNGTTSGLSLSTKNEYNLGQNPTSLTLHFNCPSVSTVTVRYWFRD